MKKEIYMKLVKKTKLSPEGFPANHHNLKGCKIIDTASGSKIINAGLVSMEPTGKADPHVHDDLEHLFIVLKGEMGVKTAQGEFRLKAGDAALISPGEVHENYNLLNKKTEYLIVTCRTKP
jgi:quercetin dioxygenase-like cupin family protein